LLEEVVGRLSDGEETFNFTTQLFIFTATISDESFTLAQRELQRRVVEIFDLS